MSRFGAAVLAALLASAWAAEEACDTPGSAGADCEAPDEAGLLQARTQTAQRRNSPQVHPHEGRVSVVHEFVGCFPRSKMDADDPVKFEDRTCVNLSYSGDPCRSGMPFYRFIMHDTESYVDCFGFCLEKGLDLSGLIYSPSQKASECRCGATPENVGVWGSKSPPKDLILPKTSVPEDSPDCSAGGMLVWAYAGGLEDDAVPFALIEASKTDLKYVHGVAKHVDPDSIVDEGGEAPGGEEESEASY